MSERRESERAAALEQRAIEQQEEARKRVDEHLRQFVLELPEEVDNTAVRNVKELVPEELRQQYVARIASPEPITKPTITRPTPEALAASRREPTPHPTMPSPAPTVTPARMPAVREPTPTSADKILVVDDDPSLLEALTNALGHEGYRVWRATDGKEALIRLFQMPRCDLILLDLHMPGMSGRDFLDVFDRSPYGHIPVVLISAHSRPDIGMLEDPRFVFVAKPLDLESLLTTVRTRIEEGRGGRE